MQAELIEGVVYVASPVSAKRHGRPHYRIIHWLATYEESHANIEGIDNATVVLDADNEVQPDVVLRQVEGGTSREGSDGYIHGSPELVVEVAASSVSIDLHDKFEAYRRNGVAEYVVWRVDDEEVDWFRLVEDDYVRVEPDEAGIFESSQFPGLRLDTRALLAGDLKGVARAVRA
jgi:Uma2 family endonuclease